MQNHWSSLRAFRNWVIHFLCQHRKALTLEIPASRTEAEAAISLPPSTKEQMYKVLRKDFLTEIFSFSNSWLLSFKKRNKIWTNFVSLLNVSKAKLPWAFLPDKILNEIKELSTHDGIWATALHVPSIIFHTYWQKECSAVLAMHGNTKMYYICLNIRDTFKDIISLPQGLRNY